MTTHCRILSLPHSLTHSLMVCATPLHQDGYSPLNWASYKGHRDCAELLLGRKADVDHQNKVTRGTHPPPPTTTTRTYARTHANTHNARVSSYHRRRHFPTLTPSYLVLMVNLGFATEQ